MKNYIKTIVSLTVICAVIAALLALGNSITAPIIEKNQASAANDSLKVVMPDGEEFQGLYPKVFLHKCFRSLVFLLTLSAKFL